MPPDHPNFPRSDPGPVTSRPALVTLPSPAIGGDQQATQWPDELAARSQSLPGKTAPYCWYAFLASAFLPPSSGARAVLKKAARLRARRRPIERRISPVAARLTAHFPRSRYDAFYISYLQRSWRAASGVNVKLHTFFTNVIVCSRV